MPTLFTEPDAPARIEETRSAVAVQDTPRHTGVPPAFGLLLRSKRLLLWSWLASLLTGVTAAAPFRAYIGRFLDHSVAAQQIAGPLDLSYLAELFRLAGRHGAISPVPVATSSLLFTLFMFFFAPGALFAMMAGVPPRLATVLGEGARYFWRFVRLTIVAVLLSGGVMALLVSIRTRWLESASARFVGEDIFWRTLVSFLLLGLVAVVLRFYFDVAEAMVVRLGLAGDRRVRRCFLPAMRAVRERGLLAFAEYFLAGTLGVALAAGFLWMWIRFAPPASLLLPFLLGQLSIVSLLLARLWQRAVVARLALIANDVGDAVVSGSVAAEEKKPVLVPSLAVKERPIW